MTVIKLSVAVVMDSLNLTHRKQCILLIGGADKDIDYYDFLQQGEEE